LTAYLWRLDWYRPAAIFQLEVDDGGYIVAGEDCKTNVAGVFAAGDIRTKRVRQLVTAAADGAVSAEMALDYLNQNCKL